MTELRIEAVEHDPTWGGPPGVLVSMDEEEDGKTRVLLTPDEALEVAKRMLDAAWAAKTGAALRNAMTLLEGVQTD